MVAQTLFNVKLYVHCLLSFIHGSGVWVDCNRYQGDYSWIVKRYQEFMGRTFVCEQCFRNKQRLGK